MSRAPGRTLIVLFFVSGACGLIYEIVWTRLFTIVIGNTVFSASAVLGVFMAGLGLGSRISGRLVDQGKLSLARVYSVLEAATGAFNLLLPILLKAAAPVFGAAYLFSHDSAVMLAFFRVAVSFVLLIVPSTLLGATLPVLVRFYVEDMEQAGAAIARVYAANTVGACIGAAVAGFVVIPRAGALPALYGAAAVNLVIAIVAWLMGGSAHHVTRASAEVDTSVGGPASGEEAAKRCTERNWTVGPTLDVPRGPRLILVAMFLSGFAALADEVAWTRVLALIVGPTTYAFTLMLCSMIAGLAIGAALASRWMQRHSATMTTFAWIEMGVAATSLALIPALGRLPLGIASLVRRYSGSIGTLQTVEFLIFFGIMLAPTIFLGMSFPVAAKLYAKSDSSLGREVSAVYGANTAGGIVGSIAAGFLLIPNAGSRATLIAAAVLSAIIGLIIAGSARRILPAVCCVLAVAAAVLVPQWNAEVMSSGAYKYAPLYRPNVDLESTLVAGDLLYFKEGAATTVSVRKNQGAVTLAVDGKVDATDAGDMTTQKMLAHLPLLLAKDPKSVAIIGFGSGVTAGSALQYPIEKLDVVEIAREVVDASRFFEHVNRNPLRDPRSRLIVDDGRNHLRYTDRRYDVIISEPSNPWISGMASLFTKEFFAESAARLADGGVHCQWFHGYNMSLDDLRTVIATFRTAFPHALLWTLTGYDLLLVGSKSPIDVDPHGIEQKFNRVQADLEGIKIRDTYTITSSFLLRDSDLDRFSRGAVLNTDDRPILEFSAPLSIYADTTAQNIAALSGTSQSPVVLPATSENHLHKAEALFAAEAFPAAQKEFEAALNEHPSEIIRLSAADFYARQGQYPKAISLLDEVVKTDPNNVDALQKLDDALAETSSPRLAEVTERLLKIAPDSAIGLHHFATTRLYAGRFDEAIGAAKKALQRDPKSGRTRSVLAIAYDRTFQPELAEAEFRRAIAASPDDWVSYNNYGIFLLGRNRAADAIQQFQRAVDLNPENTQGLVGMSEALDRAGRTREAQAWRRRAEKLK